MRRLCSALVLVAALAAVPPAADAAILPGQTIDRPSTDIKGFGNVDVAPDGTGAAVYVKKVGSPGVEHIFVSRIAGGAYGAPERVDTGVATASHLPRVAASNGGKLVVVYTTDFTTAANEKPKAAVSPGAGQPFADVTGLSTGNPFPAVDVDANPAGQAYAIGTEKVGANTNVHAFRLTGTTATQVGGTQLDNAAGNEAGGFGNQDQPRIAVTGDGNAVAAWPEKEPASNEINLRLLTG